LKLPQNEQGNRRNGGKTLARLRLEFSGAASRLGRVPLLGAILRKLGNRLVPRGTLVWAKIESGPARGLRVLVDARTGAEQRRGIREPAVQETLLRSLSAGDAFFDLGANVGFFSLLASRQVGPEGKVTAFEPDPEIAERLRQTIERNHASNMKVVEAAVWSSEGAVSFERAFGSPDRGLGHVTGGGVGGEQISVRAITLDEYARTATAPDVIKCDVEGAEVEVFRGARQLLGTRRPVVICEVHSAENLEQLRSLFQETGYHMQLLEPEGNFPIHILAVAKR
jgi:FkbM family methyltransferase